MAARTGVALGILQLLWATTASAHSHGPQNIGLGVLVMLVGLATIFGGALIFPFGGTWVRIISGVVLGLIILYGGELQTAPGGPNDPFATLAVLGVLGLAAVHLRRFVEPVLSWYYFTFHPHPAQQMVRSSIGVSGVSVGNARALADALGELPPDNPILRRVRFRQAEKLYGELRVANEARAKAIAREAEAQAIKDHENAAFFGSQEAVGLASVALERAKASFDAAQSLSARRAS